jgi:hypothetical protein
MSRRVTQAASNSMLNLKAVGASLEGAIPAAWPQYRWREQPLYHRGSGLRLNHVGRSGSSTWTYYGLPGQVLRIINAPVDALALLKRGSRKQILHCHLAFTDEPR